MTETMKYGARGMRLDALLEQAIAALTLLDAEALESLATEISRQSSFIERPQTRTEWSRASARHWVFSHLLGETARRLAMLRRVAPEARFSSYAGRGGPELSISGARDSRPVGELVPRGQGRA